MIITSDEPPMDRKDKFIRLQSMLIILAFIAGMVAGWYGSSQSSRDYARPQGIVTEAGISSMIMAEAGNDRPGEPIQIRLTRYSVTPNVGWDGRMGRPVTRFCRSASFPSREIQCIHSSAPFDLNAVGRQQALDFGDRALFATTRR